MKNSEILRLAKSKIADPKNWGIYNMAKNAEGCAVLVTRPEACQFCAVGSVARAVYELYPDRGNDVSDMQDSIAPTIFDALLETYTGDNKSKVDKSLVSWRCFMVAYRNDEMKHADVMTWFDRAIAKLEADND